MNTRFSVLLPGRAADPCSGAGQSGANFWVLGRSVWAHDESAPSSGQQMKSKCSEKRKEIEAPPSCSRRRLMDAALQNQQSLFRDLGEGEGPGQCEQIFPQLVSLTLRSVNNILQ